jgi:hypothetical protein
VLEHLPAAARFVSQARGWSPSLILATPSTSCLQRYVPGGGYFAAERSFAQHRLKDAHRTVVAFGQEPCTLLLASFTGAFHHLRFDPGTGGACEVLNYANFMEEAD